jgi:CrcB protein
VSGQPPDMTAAAHVTPGFQAASGRHADVLVNVTGAFILGLLVGVALDRNAYLIAGTGLIGAFTTFSTWTLECQRLGEDGELALGTANFTLSLILGVATAWAGRRLGMAL